MLQRRYVSPACCVEVVKQPEKEDECLLKSESGFLRRTLVFSCLRVPEVTERRGSFPVKFWSRRPGGTP